MRPNAGFLVAALFLMFQAVPSNSEAPRQSSWSLSLPELSGSHGVGRRQYFWIDMSRVEMGAATADERRRLVVWLWYPASASHKKTNVPVLPDNWSEALPYVSMFGDLSARAYADRHVHAVVDAEPTSEEVPYPVVFFLPGFGRVPTDYTYLIENLVSHGYVVVGINPTGFSSATVFPDGKIIGPSYPPDTTPGFKYEQWLRWWLDDARFVFGQLTQEPSATKDLPKGYFDFQRLGIFGHSFGGATAAQILAEMTQFKAGVDLDGGLYGPVIDTGVQQPFMLVDSHSDLSADNFGPGEWPDIAADIRKVEAGWRKFSEQSPNSYLLTIRKSDHRSYSDDALIPVEYRKPELRQQVADRMDGVRALKLIGRYVNGFFDVQLKKKCSTLLNTVPKDAPEVSIKGHHSRKAICSKEVS